MYWINNDYFYYGQASNLVQRFNTHKESMRKGRHRNPKIQSIYNKYGLPLFEVLEKCELECLDEKEQYYIDLYFGQDNCCNLLPLATSTRGRKHSPETIEKNRQSKIGLMVGEKNPFFGRKHSDKTKRLISQSKKGKKFPKIAEAKRGIKASEATRKLFSEIRKYDGSWKAKKVINTETGEIYSCAQEVVDKFNLIGSTFRSRLNGTLKNTTTFIYLINFSTS